MKLISIMKMSFKNLNFLELPLNNIFSLSHLFYTIHTCYEHPECKKKYDTIYKPLLTLYTDR